MGADILWHNKSNRSFFWENSYNLKIINDQAKWVNFLGLIWAKGIVCFDFPAYKGLKRRVFKKLMKINKNQKLLYCWEPPVYAANNYEGSLQKLFIEVFVTFDDLVRNQGLNKFYYPAAVFRMAPIGNEIGFSFEQKKLSVVIAGNKTSRYPNELYSERVRTIEFFEQKIAMTLTYMAEDGINVVIDAIKGKQPLN